MASKSVAAALCCLGIAGCATTAAQKPISISELYANPALYQGKTVTVRAYFLNITDNRYLISARKDPNLCLNISGGFEQLHDSGKGNQWVTVSGIVNMNWGVPPPGEERLIWLRCADDGAIFVQTAR